MFSPCNNSMFASTSGSRCIKVVANRTPPPNANSPITNVLEERTFGPLDLVNQSFFNDIRRGRQPHTIEMANRHTIVIILAFSTFSIVFFVNSGMFVLVSEFQ